MNATASGIDWRLTDEEILAWLNEIVSKPTGLRVTFGDIQAAIGLQGLGEVVEAFEEAAQTSAALRPTMTGLSSVGVLLDSPERLGVLQMVCPPQHFAAIKALAITEGPRWSIELAMGTQPTLATIAAERAQYDREIDRLSREREFAAIYEAWVSAYQSGFAFINNAKSSRLRPPTIEEVCAHITEAG